MTFIKKELLSVSTAHFCPEIDCFRTKKGPFSATFGECFVKNRVVNAQIIRMKMALFLYLA